MKENQTLSKENYSVEEIKLESNIKKELVFMFGTLLISAIIFGAPFYLIWQEVVHDFINYMLAHREGIFALPLFERIRAIMFQGAVSLIIFGVITLVHELVHGIFYGIFATNKFKSIKMGFLIKSFTAYCICNEKLKINHSRVGLTAPLVIMGIIPIIISIFIGNAILFLLGFFTIIMSCGDMQIFLKFSKFSNDSWVYEEINGNKELLMSIYTPTKSK